MLDSLQARLAPHFDVEHYFDLNELDQAHASVLLSRLEPVRQAEYADRYRIVFYYSEPLTRTYDDEPCDIIESLQRTLAYLDIPNFFVLVAGPDPQVAVDLQRVHRQYAATEDQPIRHINV